jgi:hypothetical protein
MDIIAYQKDRDTELSNFKQEYDDLKIQYSRYLSDAVYGNDPTLIDKVLAINAELAAHVREFVGQANGKYDQKTVLELTNDIIRYQNEYTAIKSSTNTADTLKNIYDKENDKYKSLKNQFDFMLMLVIGCLALVLFLIFTTSSGLPQLLPKLPSQYTATLS